MQKLFYALVSEKLVSWKSGRGLVIRVVSLQVLTREEVEEKANTVDNTDHQVVEKETLHVDDHVKKADELEVTQHSENAHDQGLIGNGTEEKMVEGDEIAITAPLEKREAESEQVDKHQTEEMEESGKDGPGGPRSPGGDVSESPIATVIVVCSITFMVYIDKLPVPVL